MGTKRNCEGSAQYEPRRIAMLKKNMLLCVDLQTLLQDDNLLKAGKVYLGTLRCKLPSVETSTVTSTSSGKWELR